MKKILALLFLVSVFHSEKSIGQGFLWANEYCDSLEGKIISIDETNDGNLIVSGFYYSAPNQIGLLIKLDLNGNVIWQKNYTSIAWFNSVRQTPDGGFILYGNSQTFINNSTYYHSTLIKTNSLGDSLWSVNVDGYLIYQNLELTQDSGYIVCSKDTASANSRFFLAKISNSGNIEWQFPYIGNGYSYCNKVIPVHDGGFMAAGNSNSHSYLLKVNSNGIEEWDTSFNNFMDLLSITELADSSILIVGRKPNLSHLGFWKYNSNGVMISFDSLNTTTGFFPEWVGALSDGGFMVTGEITDSSVRKFYCAKFNSQSQFLWDYKYTTPNPTGTFYNKCLNEIQSSINGNYYLVGGTQMILDTYYPTIICLSPWATTIQCLSSSNNSCKIFSSLDGAVQIQFNQTENYSLDIFDLNGKLISHSAGNNFEVNENFNLPSEVYLIKVSTKNFTDSELFPVVH